MTRHATPLVVISLALALLGAFACGGGADAPRAAPLDIGAAPIPVVTAPAERLASPHFVVATADLEPARRVATGTKLLGRVAEVPVAAGDAVRRGDVLVRLESRDLTAAVAQASAAVAMAEAELTNAAAHHERMRQLESRGSATVKSLEDATAAWRVAAAGVEQVRAAREVAAATLSYATVTSPLDGWVLATHVEPGDMARPGAALVTVDDLSRIEVALALPESELAGLAVGDRLEVEAGGLLRPAEIARLVPAGDAASRTFRVEAVVDNADGALRPGMYARARIPRGERSTLWVPTSAIVERGQLEGVFVVDAEPGDEAPRARLRWVTLGERRDDRREVLSGLADGERYVVSPPFELRDGSPVEVTP